MKNSPDIIVVPVRETVRKKDPKDPNRPGKLLIKGLIQDWKISVGILALGLLLGLITILLQPRQYVSKTTLLPEYASTIGYASNILDSRIGSILSPISASTYRGRTDAVRIDLYPALMTSNLVFKNVLNATLYDSTLFGSRPFSYVSGDTTDRSLSPDGTPVAQIEASGKHSARPNLNTYKTTVFQYLQNDYRPTFSDWLQKHLFGFWSTLSTALQSDSDTKIDEFSGTLSNKLTYYHPTEEEAAAIQRLRQLVSATFDMNTGAIQLEIRASDPFVAAMLSRQVILSTHKLIVEYQKEKYKLDYDFLRTELQIKREAMEKERLELAAYIDRNVNTYSAEQQSELFQKEYDFNLANSIYRSYAFQVEESRLKSEEETPLFTYLHPVEIPGTPDTASNQRTLFIFLALSVFALLFRGLLRLMKQG